MKILKILCCKITCKISCNIPSGKSPPKIFPVPKSVAISTPNKSNILIVYPNLAERNPFECKKIGSKNLKQNPNLKVFSKIFQINRNPARNTKKALSKMSCCNIIKNILSRIPNCKSIDEKFPKIS